MTAQPAEIAGEELEGGFSRRAVRWIVGVAAVSFSIGILLSAFGDRLDQGPTPGANTFSHSALGHRALAELLRSLGLGVVSRQGHSGGIGPHRPLVVAEPEESHRLPALLREAASRQAALVLVLPKWEGRPKQGRPEWIGEVALLSPAVLMDVLGDAELDPGKLAIRRASPAPPCTGRWGSNPRFRVESAPLQLLKAGSGLEPVVECGSDVLVARRPGKPDLPELILVTDPDVLNNQGLGRGDNAPLVHALLVESLKATGVVFDETVHGFSRTPGLLAEAFRFPLVLAVLQGLVLVATVLWAGMGRFGKPLPARPPLEAGKEILIDNTARLLASGGHTADSLARFVRQTTRAVAAHCFLPPDLPDGELLARLQQITNSHGIKMDLAGLERRVRLLPSGARGDERAARIARQLHRWRLEMTHGIRKGS